MSGERRFQVSLEKSRKLNFFHTNLQKNPNSLKYFIHSNLQVVESGARNCIFIKTTLEEPHKLVSELIDRSLKLKVLIDKSLDCKTIHCIDKSLDCKSIH